MIGLALASLWSWAVIIDKLFRFAALNREANRFEDAVASGRAWRTSPPRPASARATPCRACCRARCANGATPAPRAPASESQARLPDPAHRPGAGRHHRPRERSGSRTGLGALAIVATASPFVGLFGTVWGIMHAFQAIAIQKNTNLAVVAPSIAEALFATAIGLVAAIPAYIAYNKFSTDAGKFSGRLEGFADDLSTAIQRRPGGAGLSHGALGQRRLRRRRRRRRRRAAAAARGALSRDQRHAAGRRDAGAADHLHDLRAAADRRRAGRAAEDRGRRHAGRRPSR